jgi:hypothetical protein
MANRGAFLTTNEYLSSGDYLVSPAALYFAIMQTDGNFCVYHGSSPTDNQGFLWGDGKTASGGEFFAIMQDDGNFVVYSGSGPNDNLGVVWASLRESLSQGSYFAIMQDDGNFCVYRGTGPDDNQGIVWDSFNNTSTSSDSNSDDLSGSVSMNDAIADGFSLAYVVSPTGDTAVVRLEYYGVTLASATLDGDTTTTSLGGSADGYTAKASISVDWSTQKVTYDVKIGYEGLGKTSYKGTLS